MTGTGSAHGAGTVINAFATGRGAAFGLRFRSTARVAPAAAWGVWDGPRRLGRREARLALETARAIQRAFGASEPLRIEIDSDIPAKKGLKSSSSVAVAVARAVLQHLDRRLNARQLLSIVGDASLASRTSLTGAFDDAAACLLGGVVFADNLNRRLLAHDRLPGTLVALVRVPKASKATGSLDRRLFLGLARQIEEAWNLGREGRYKEAMLVNTLTYAPRLGLRPLFSLRALTLGAYAAGVSGKGPAEVALVHRDLLDKFSEISKGCRVVELAQAEPE